MTGNPHGEAKERPTAQFLPRIRHETLLPSIPDAAIPTSVDLGIYMDCKLLAFDEIKLHGRVPGRQSWPAASR